MLEYKSTILLVDDDTVILTLLSEILMRDNTYVLTAVGAEDGLDKIKRNRVDLVISDQNMPGMSGLEFLTYVRKEYPDIVTMMMTVSSHLEISARAVDEIGVYQFILKPFNVTDLRLAVRRALEYKQLVAERTLLLKALVHLEPFTSGAGSGELRDLLHRLHLDAPAPFLEASN